jgi:hypothetical protein
MYVLYEYIAGICSVLYIYQDQSPNSVMVHDDLIMSGSSRQITLCRLGLRKLPLIEVEDSGIYILVCSPVQVSLGRS